MFWPSINNLHTVVRATKAYGKLQPGECIKYKAKTKLHGMNVIVRVKPDASIVTYSRHLVIDENSPAKSFKHFVTKNESCFKLLAKKDRDVLVCGEWCGPGINKGASICHIESKVFAVFAIIDGVFVDNALSNDRSTFIVEPNTISELLRPCRGVQGVHVIPWSYRGEEFDLDLANPGPVAGKVVDRINALVDEIETRDPWVYEQFGADGGGEGLVFYPVTTDTTIYPFVNYAFKAKGAKHKVLAHSPSVQVEATVSPDVLSFAENVLAVARLEQAEQEIRGSNKPFSMNSVANFIKWIANDVRKEAPGEIEALVAQGHTEKEIMKVTCSYARDWYLARFKETS